MATIDDLVDVLAAKAGSDRESLARYVDQLRAAELLPDDPAAPVGAAHATALLLSMMAAPLGYASNVSARLWGELPLESTVTRAWRSST